MMGEHSSKQYDLDLESIRSRVLLMGGMVETQLLDATTAFRSGNLERADAAIKADAQVNQLEVQLDEACSNLIVKRQPAANDLRAVMATIKMIKDLERIGDEASKIARTAKDLTTRNNGNLINHFAIVRMVAANAATMLHDALDAFARLDAQAAVRLIAMDDEIDHEYRGIMRSMVTYMMEDPRTISAALDTMWVAKSLERIGDHAKNIAEYVIYVVEGKDVRHTDYAATRLGKTADSQSA
ncbi:phosphate signaling complex protein PhoU [Massilia sp. W12]|uniref:phosphate signaling complex protein PhoU n=1 Tax=Massilia sp. W12 TaxID=3126507 RepID=UPI0030CEF000